MPDDGITYKTTSNIIRKAYREKLDRNISKTTAKKYAPKYIHFFLDTGFLEKKPNKTGNKTATKKFKKTGYKKIKTKNKDKDETLNVFYDWLDENNIQPGNTFNIQTFLKDNPQEDMEDIIKIISGYIKEGKIRQMNNYVFQIVSDTEKDK